MRHPEREALAALAGIIEVDPGGRGLSHPSGDDIFRAARGGLEGAARSLAAEGHLSIIVTGFTIPGLSPPAPETDGPPGAIALARGLRALGQDALIATDAATIPLIAAAAPELAALAIPNGAEAEPWVECLRRGPRPTHIIAVERVGPSYEGPCRSMRGLAMDELAAPSHLLFERLGATTIGIGDGGNELGMGRVPRALIAKLIPNGAAIACRVPCDHLIAAGVSNWGAFALLAALALLAQRPEVARAILAPEAQHAVLAAIVSAGAVDGCTGRREATVDGLPWDEHRRVLERISAAIS